MDFLARPFLALLAASSFVLAQSAPVIDTPPTNGSPTTFPVGKVLIFPITATDADGDPLTYRVASDNPRLIVRVKTGNPRLKLNISHSGGSTGSMEFLLFREWTPITTSFIAGFAQSGFYDGVKFHRIVKDFVLQGGDPRGDGTGGPGMTSNVAATAYKFDNELQAGLIFTGRGQLAMANSGYANDYSGTNGSQFFITVEQPRFLDFKHTIFGQMIRGWDLLDTLENVPVVANDRPTQDVTITSAAVEPDQQNAVLMVSAIGHVPAPGANVTVTVDDGKGGVGSRVIKFTTLARDTVNDPPVVGNIAHQNVARETQLDFRLPFFDLESDYMGGQLLAHGLLGASTASGRSSQFGPVAAVLGNDGYSGLLRMGFQLGQFSMFRTGSEPATVQSYATITVGDRPLRADPLELRLTPNAAFSGVVARVRDLDPAAQPSDYTGNVKINWGDGTPIVDGTLARDSSVAGPANFAVSGTHTYAREGIYTITTTLQGSKGARSVIRSTAVVSADSIVAVGETLDIRGPTVANRIIATFTDSTSPGAPSSYFARIDWGDGTWSRGTIIRRADGSYMVRASHTYRDAEPFAVSVRINENGADPATDAVAWSLIRLSGFTPAQRHLPPFPMAHLVAAWNSGPNKQVTSPLSGPQLDPNKLTETLTGAFIVLNAGTKASPTANLRYHLSAAPVRIASFTAGAPTTVTTTTAHGLTTGDEVVITDVTGGSFSPDINNVHSVTVVNATQFTVNVQCTNPSVTLAGTVFSKTNPLNGATRLQVNGLPEITVVSFLPDGGGQGSFTISLPSSNRSGAGRYLISELVYSDPILDRQKVSKVVLSGPIDPALLIYDVQSELGQAGGGQYITDENGKKVTFRVVLDTPPTANVVFQVESTVVGEGTVSPAALTFTPANWNVAQTVTVTGANDGTAKDGTKAYKVNIKTPTTTDPNYIGLGARDLSFINLDND